MQTTMETNVQPMETQYVALALALVRRRRAAAKAVLFSSADSSASARCTTLPWAPPLHTNSVKAGAQDTMHLCLEAGAQDTMHVCLEAGSQGTVHLCIDERTRMIVAVKNFNNVADMMCELKAYRLLPPHPNVLHLLSADEPARTIVFESCMCDVFELLFYVKKINEECAASFTHQLVSALAHVHAHGVAHCDVKLENIMVAVDNTIRLGDFGLATTTNAMHQTRQCGSRQYMAPEVLCAVTPYDATKADMWSVGVCAFVMVYGHFPYNYKDLELNAACSSGFRPWEQLNAFSSDAFHKVVDSLLCYDPMRRASADSVLEYAWLTSRM